MRLGTDVVAWKKGFVIYAKLAPAALAEIRKCGLFDEFNICCEGRGSLFRGRGWKPSIKRGNKFLRKRGLPELQALSFLEIATIQEGGAAPAGSLIAKMHEPVAA